MEMDKAKHIRQKIIFISVLPLNCLTNKLEHLSITLRYFDDLREHIRKLLVGFHRALFQNVNISIFSFHLGQFGHLIFISRPCDVQEQLIQLLVDILWYNRANKAERLTYFFEELERTDGVGELRKKHISDINPIVLKEIFIQATLLIEDHTINQLLIILYHA